MKTLEVCAPAEALEGSVPVPSDQGVLLARIAQAVLSRGTSRFDVVDVGGRVQAFLAVLSYLGISVVQEERAVRVTGVGLGSQPLSGDTIEVDARGHTDLGALLLGLLAGRSGSSRLLCDATLFDGLGALFEARGLVARRIVGGVHVLELVIFSERPPGIEVDLGAAPAWVKQSILLLGLRAQTQTVVREACLSADHLERSLLRGRAPLFVHSAEVTLHPPRDVDALGPDHYEFIGSHEVASYLLVCPLIAPRGGRVTVREVASNSSASATVALLRWLGAEVHIEPRGDRQGEPLSDWSLIARGPLRGGAVVSGELLTRQADAVLPLVAALACASRPSRIEGACFTQRDGSNRIVARATGVLKNLGLSASADGTDWVVGGSTALPLERGLRVTTGGDPRLALFASVIGLAGAEPSRIDDAACVGEIFPRCSGTLRALGADARLLELEA